MEVFWSFEFLSSHWDSFCQIPLCFVHTMLWSQVFYDVLFFKKKMQTSEYCSFWLLRKQQQWWQIQGFGDPSWQIWSVTGFEGNKRHTQHSSRQERALDVRKQTRRDAASYRLPFLLPLPSCSSPPRHWTLTPWSSLWLQLNISIQFCLSGSPSDLPGWARERLRFAWRAVEWILYTVIYKWRTCLEVSVHMNTRSLCTPLFWTSNVFYRFWFPVGTWEYKCNFIYFLQHLTQLSLEPILDGDIAEPRTFFLNLLSLSDFKAS